MRKRLTTLGLLLGGISFHAEAAQNMTMQNYLSASGMPANSPLAACKPLCVGAACDAGINNKTYGCFRGCSNHNSNSVIITCASKQFNAYVANQVAQLNAAIQQNNNQTAQIGALKEKMQRLKDKKVALRGQNQDQIQQISDIQAKIDASGRALEGVIRNNIQLKAQLVAAQQTINQKDARIAALNAQIAANQAEINRLNGELDIVQQLFMRLMKQTQEIMGIVEGSEEAFSDHIRRLREVDGALKEQMLKASELINVYKKDLLPYVAQKKEDFEKLDREMQESIDIARKFIEGAEAFVNETRERLKSIEKDIPKSK